MNVLSDAVIKLLVASLTDLGGRVFVSLIPPDEAMPAATVDVSSADDPVLGGGEDAAGIERAVVAVRLTDEDTAGESTGIGSLAVNALEVLTGRDSSAAALAIPGWTVLDAGASTVRTFATSEQGRRYVHAAITVEVVMERS